MKSSLSKTKVVIPAVVVVAAILIGLTAFNPLSATAQQQQQANSPKSNNSAGTSTASTAMAANLHNETMPKIAGSVNILQVIKDKIKINFSEAASSAQKEVSNGTVVAGHIGVVQGYLVYRFIVVDSTIQTIHMVIVDAGNGQVLYTSPARPISSLGEHGFGEHHSGMVHGFGGMGKY